MDYARGSDQVYKICIYVRESRDDNEENYETIETQKDLLVEYVKKHRLGDIVLVCIDDNVSGVVFERKGIERLKEAVKSGQVNMLLLKDLSRLGRNNAKTLLFLDFLEEYNVRVITYDGRYDSIRDNDTVGIDTWFNERYIRDLSKKIRANLRFKIAKGEYIGHAPYGYIKSAEEKNRLVVDKTTAGVVKEIFELYIKGYGYASIARQMDLKGHPAPAARRSSSELKSRWNAVAVKRILANMVYLGHTVQGVSERVSFKSKKSRRLPKESWVITEGTHEAIIGKDEFMEVKKIMESKKAGKGPHKGVLHLLRGLLYCGKCGSIMFARKRMNRPMGYICSKYARMGRGHCTSHFINEEEIKDVLKIDLLALLGQDDIKSRLLGFIERDFFKNDDMDVKITEARRQLREKQRQQDALYLDKLEGRISEQLFKRMNNTLENKILYFIKEIEELENSKASALSSQEIIENVLSDIKENKINYEVVRLLVKRIVVFDAGDSPVNIPLNELEKDLAGENGMVVIEYNL
jgi:DNA invertase Pin-like site-specific DNA recombinase